MPGKTSGGSALAVTGGSQGASAARQTDAANARIAGLRTMNSDPSGEKIPTAGEVTV
jgi:hypothetical protein